MKDLEGQRVVVLGAGRSGRAAARLAHRMGGRVRVSEGGAPDRVPGDFARWLREQDIPSEWNGHTRAFVQSADLVVISPGIPVDAPPARWARQAGCRVVGEMELAAWFCRPPIIAVTGSNGKTTVSTLLYRVIEKAGYRACLCGNIGTPLAEKVLELDGVDYVVLEVSSFQLESVERFRPHGAVVLNVTQNHLDRHRDIDEYWAIKKRIFLNQGPEDFAVLNAADRRLRKEAGRLRARVRLFDGQGASANEAAVIRAAAAIGIDRRVCESVFTSFEGLAHRLEPVGCFHGVTVINDSKSTTVEAGRWALQRVGAPVILICGGKDKNSDFSSLKEPVGRKVRRMVVLGQAAEKLRAAFDGVVPVIESPSLEAAVSEARRTARPGETVLLSPMCASFDMFANYEERGEAFKALARRAWGDGR